MRLWHVWAKRMHDDGVPLVDIALRFGKSVSTVQWAVYPKVRESTRNRVRNNRLKKKIGVDPRLKNAQWIAWLNQ